MSRIGSQFGTEWPRRPLCCRYILVQFGGLPLQVRAELAVHQFSLTWVLGTLDDGQHELLGAWPTPPLGTPNLREVFDDLATRGVERIRFVINADPETLRSAHPRATALSPATRQTGASWVRDAALSARLRRIVSAAETQAQLIQAELARLVRRHGVFDGTATALDFLEKTLERLERCFWAGTSARADPARRWRSMAEPRSAASV